MRLPKQKDRPDLDRLLRESAERVKKMTPDELTEMLRAQSESWVRAEMSWPKAKFSWVNGAKVYDSFEDYCND